MKLNLISVVIPVFNVERYIEQCLESVINQTYANLEIILIDDGSTDKSGNICDEYVSKDSRIKVIHKENGGLSSARNIGINISTGEYICFVDSDDYIDKDMIITMYNFQQKYEADIVTCGRYIVDEDGKIINKYFTIENEKVYNNREAIEKLLLWDTLDSASWDKMYKKDLFEDIRYPLNVLSEDYDTTSRLLYKANKVVHVGIPLYYYRQRQGSITKEGLSKKRIAIFIQVYKLSDFVINKFPDLEEACSFFIGMHIISLQRLALNNCSVEFNDELELAVRENKKSRKYVLRCHYFTIIQKIKYIFRELILEIYVNLNHYL